MTNRKKKNNKQDSIEAYRNEATILEAKNMLYLKKYDKKKETDDKKKETDDDMRIQITPPKDSDKYSDLEKVEAMLVQYRITPTGQIERDKQVPFLYDADFHPTRDGKMRLKLSQD